jgi:hypothetical protein
MSESAHYFLSFYVPEEHAEHVKSAVFQAGAGRLGDYEQCCWQTSGLGQFQPVAGATPFIGEVDRLERLAELKVEMICRADVIREVIAAMKRAHPYEEPAYHVLKIESEF